MRKISLGFLISSKMLLIRSARGNMSRFLVGFEILRRCFRYHLLVVEVRRILIGF